MKEFIDRDSEQFRELTGTIETARCHIRAIGERHRPSIAGQTYLTGEEVMQYLHISPRTLQNLRDNHMIGFVTLGGKILYPERELLQILEENHHPHSHY